MYIIPMETIIIEKKGKKKKITEKIKLYSYSYLYDIKVYKQYRQVLIHFIYTSEKVLQV